MKLDDSKLAHLLVERRLVTPAQVSHAQELAQRHHLDLPASLIRCGYLSEEIVVRAVAAHLHVQPWNLKADPPTAEALRCLPRELCTKHKVLPVQRRSDLLIVAMEDVRNLHTLEEIRNSTSLRIEPVLAYGPRLLAHLSETHVGTSDRSIDNFVHQALAEYDGSLDTRTHSHEIHNEIDTRPVVGLVNQILEDAISSSASDIHFEPRESEVDVRFRIDGRLIKIDTIPSELMPMVVARIKIMSELDVVEFRLPQDGRITIRYRGRPIDLRVSVLPTLHGAKIVLRLHDRSKALTPLAELGHSPAVVNQLLELGQKPYGLVLVTGPTGSGKTTTLYSLLTAIQSESLNISTAEDPIEFDLPGINQTQINEKLGMTFARQLRALLRQDPDVILLGEIRDQETAEMAIRASMTGHLVLSTLHANDAISAIPRLLDLGIDRSLLSNSLIGILAQRLARKSCSECDTTGTDCNACRGTGYRGRTAVGELLCLDSPMQQALASSACISEIMEMALNRGYQTMQARALELVESGITSLEEVKRIVYFEDTQTLKIQRAA